MPALLSAKSSVALSVALTMALSIAATDAGAATPERVMKPDGGSCSFPAHPAVDLMPPVNSSAPILMLDFASVEGELRLGVYMAPDGYAKDGPAQIQSATITFRKQALLAADRVSVDGKLLSVNPAAGREPGGKWRALSSFAFWEALMTGDRLDVEANRNGVPERRSLDLRPLRKAAKAVEQVHWRCD
jgi:hypothetical protein